MDGNIPAALQAGGAQFGRQAKAAIQAAYPQVTGLNLDWEVGNHNNKPRVLPTQSAMDNFTAQFVDAAAPLHVTVCLAQWTSYVANFSSVITASRVHGVYDMGLYHGTSTSEWNTKLDDALGNIGSTRRSFLAAGLELAAKYPWENTTGSVVDRFAALKRAGVKHVALFAWYRGGVMGIPPEVSETLTTQLREFTGGC